MDFNEYKKAKSKLASIAKEKADQKPSYADDRFWELTRDKSDVGEAVIRFLSLQDVDEFPITNYLNHSFQQHGQWFWENCPKTLDMSNPCPVCDYTQPYWDKGTEESKAIAGKYSRKKNYIANILVVTDPAKPENNGKVFLFKFGKTIYEKIKTKIAPKSELITQSIIYDLWEGQNFRIATKSKGGYVNYDDSAFLDNGIGPVADSDEGINKIFDLIRPLDEFTAENKFSTFDAIEKKFNAIMRIGSSSTKATKSTPDKSSGVNEMLEEDSTEKTTEKVIKNVPEEEEGLDDFNPDDFNFGDDDDIAF